MASLTRAQRVPGRVAGLFGECLVDLQEDEIDHLPVIVPNQVGDEEASRIRAKSSLYWLVELRANGPSARSSRVPAGVRM